MGKRKKTKTYFVFITIEGRVGLAAGLEKPSNEEVKEADSKELIANGFRRRGCVFTRLGDLDIDQARKMKEEGKLRVKGRYHVPYFLQILPELESEAPLVARDLRDSLERSKQCRAAYETRRSALEASREMMENVLQSLGYDPRIRGEVLDIGGFAKIADKITRMQDADL